jgi:hypothetical protein
VIVGVVLGVAVIVMVGVWLGVTELVGGSGVNEDVGVWVANTTGVQDATRLGVLDI